MAVSKTTKFANRCGLDIKVWPSGTSAFTGTPLLTIDYANLTNISVTGDRVYATGGQKRRNKIGYNNPLSGTLKVTTQLMSAELLTLMSGKEITTEAPATTTINFETIDTDGVADYVITGETVWKDDAGNLIAESLVAHKAIPVRALNVDYKGGDDVASVDVEFELHENDAGKILSLGFTDYSAPQA